MNRAGPFPTPHEILRHFLILRMTEPGLHKLWHGALREFALDLPLYSRKSRVAAFAELARSRGSRK